MHLGEQCGYHHTENSALLFLSGKRSLIDWRIPQSTVREMDASLFHYGPTIRPVGECANIVACKDIVLPLPQ